MGYCMNDLTLASVEEAFQQWRTGRRNRTEPIPEAMPKLNPAIQLTLQDHTRSIQPKKAFIQYISNDCAQPLINYIEFTLVYCNHSYNNTDMVCQSQIKYHKQRKH